MFGLHAVFRVFPHLSIKQQKRIVFARYEPILLFKFANHNNYKIIK